MVLSSLQCTGQPHSREPPDPGISPAPAQEAGLSLGLFLFFAYTGSSPLCV